MAAVLVAAIVIGFLSLQLFQQLRGLQEAPVDNLQWNVTQLELDVARMENGIQAALATPDAPLDDLRRRFDLFYSRANTVARGSMLPRLGLEETGAPLMGRLQGFLDRYVPLIDGSDDALRAGLPDMEKDVAALRLDMRNMAIRMIEAHAALQDTRRTELALVVRNTAVAGAVLVFLLLLLLLLVLQLNREARYRAEETRRISRRLEATVETALDAVVISDLRGVVTGFNAAAERIFGYSRDQALGQSLAELIIPERHVAAHEAGMERMRRNGERRVVDRGRVDMTARDRSGREFPVELSITSADGPDGPIFIGFLRDTTEARAAEAALINARDSAEAAERTKTNFIAVMSHEMRTPLNGMMAALDIIGQGRLDDRQQRFLAIARESSNQLLRHVNDVLEISRIEAGRIVIQHETIDLAALLATLVEPMVPLAAQRGTAIDLSLPDALPPVVGDPFRLGQIVQNLLSNAVKFTEGGRIQVTASSRPVSPGEARVTLQVQDSGIGIAPADQARIFQEFEMVDPSHGRKVGGTGLGLAISSRLARAMGGDITVESALGRGSTFTLVLQMQRAPDHGAARPTRDETVTALDRALSVLVVEDNPTNRMVLEEMLRGLGHQVELAKDGAEGVSKARARRFDLVLMDLSMPRVDGWTATTLIRADGASRDSRILAVTAHAATRQDPRFAGSGFDGLLTKPLTTRDLASALVDGPPPALSPADPDLPLLDPVRIAELQAMGRPASQRLFGQARDDLARCLERIAAPEPGGTGVAAILHEAAGVAAVIGARRLHALLQAAEGVARGGTAAETGQACTPLDRTWRQTEAELARVQGAASLLPPGEPA